MRKLLLLLLAGAFSSPALAQTLSCDGTESGGSGVVSTECSINGLSNLRYTYPVTDPNGSLQHIYIGTHDGDITRYVNVCKLSTWGFEIILNNFQDYSGKTAHGGTSPGPDGNCPYVIHFYRMAGSGPVNFTFGFNHPWHSHDVGWSLVDDVGATVVDWGADVGLGFGPVHAPVDNTDLGFGASCTADHDPPCDDAPTSSLGLFKIWVLPQYQTMMANYPGYNGTTGILTSPYLYDPVTQIGRSAPHLDGDPSDVGGTAVGSAATVISDLHMFLRPPGFEGPAGTREVHTEIVSLNMTDWTGFGVLLQAGRPTYAHLALSPGEVESKAGPIGGDPAQDFPAESFFNANVEAFLPPAVSLPEPGATLYNLPHLPLLVYNDNLLRFPPRVVYIHGHTPAVPVFFRNDNLPHWVANAPFGFLIVAGHGLGFLPDYPGDLELFEGIVLPLPPLPVPPTVACDGTESGGSGEVEATCLPGPRMYSYPVSNEDQSLTDLYIGTVDANVRNYSSICMPPGWTFTVEENTRDIQHNPGKTAHGDISPGPDGNCPFMIHWSGPAEAVGTFFKFGYNHKWPSHDVEWQAVNANGTTSADWDVHVGYGIGPVHAPMRGDIPAVTDWGMAVLVLLVLAAGTVVLRRARAQRAQA